MNTEFEHLRRYPALIGLIFFTGFSLMIAYMGGDVIPWYQAFLINPAFFLSLFFFIYSNDKIILTPTGIIKKNLIYKKHLLYADLASVKEGKYAILLLTGNNIMYISRQMEGFSELYGLILQRSPTLKAGGIVSFPLTLRSRKGAIREIVFDADMITLMTTNKRMRWKIAQLGKIQFQQTYHEIKSSRGFNMSPDDYYALHRLSLSFHTGHDFVLDAEQTRYFGYSPERLALILRRLYPDKFFSNVYDKPVNEEQRQRDQAEAHLAWGDKLRKEGKYKEAIAEYAAAIDLNPEHRAYKHEIGNLYFSLEQYDEAITAYRKMLQYFPDHQPSWERLSQCLLLSGQTQEAEEALTHIAH